MITINLDKLRNDLNSPMKNSSYKIKDNDIYLYHNIFREILSILINNNFWQPIEGKTSKSRYLNNIQHFI